LKGLSELKEIAGDNGDESDNENEAELLTQEAAIPLKELLERLKGVRRSDLPTNGSVTISMFPCMILTYSLNILIIALYFPRLQKEMKMIPRMRKRMKKKVMKNKMGRFTAKRMTRMVI